MNDLDMVKKDLNKKIDKVDKILEDDKLYDEYITDIEQKYEDISDDIIQKVKINLKNRNIKTKLVEKQSNYRAFQLTKIAASAIFAILIWNSFIYKNNTNFESINANKVNKGYKVMQSKVYLNIDNKLKDINGFLLNPIENNKK